MELSSKVNVVNFALGAEALEQRLLACVLRHMQPKVDDSLTQLAATQQASRHMVIELQTKLLTFISKCPGLVRVGHPGLTGRNRYSTKRHTAGDIVDYG